MKKSLLIWVIIGITTLTSTMTFACPYNGYDYPAGTVIGGLTCQGDGSWK